MVFKISSIELSWSRPICAVFRLCLALKLVYNALVWFCDNKVDEAAALDDLQFISRPISPWARPRSREKFREFCFQRVFFRPGRMTISPLHFWVLITNNSALIVRWVSTCEPETLLPISEWKLTTSDQNMSNYVDFFLKSKPNWLRFFSNIFNTLRSAVPDLAIGTEGRIAPLFWLYVGVGAARDSRQLLDSRVHSSLVVAYSRVRHTRVRETRVGHTSRRCGF